MKQADLIGKTVTFEYSNETYRIEVQSDSRLKWTRTEGDPIGASDLEDYVFSVLAPDLVMLTWVETDGLGLSNTLRFSDMKLVTHALIGRDVFENAGTFSVT